jgi:hypothetical protein
LGVDADTAVLVETDGSAKVVGSGYAYFVWPGAGNPSTNNGVLQTPLTFPELKVRRIGGSAGQFQFADGWSTGATYYTIDVDQGNLTVNGNGGSLY